VVGVAEAFGFLGFAAGVVGEAEAEEGAGEAEIGCLFIDVRSYPSRFAVRRGRSGHGAWGLGQRAAGSLLRAPCPLLLARAR
jgi:hypothetical protein